MYTYARLTSIIFKTEKVKYAKLVTMITRKQEKQGVTRTLSGKMSSPLKLTIERSHIQMK